MSELSVDDLFDAAVRIQLRERTIIITLASDNTVRIKFPITRVLADFLGIPHYAVLRSFARMEEEGLVRREERIGIVTTQTGSRKMIALMTGKYRRETGEILGPVILEDILMKVRS